MSATDERPKGGLLKGARVYLSGPMDFVACRTDEMRFGWRSRVGAFLRAQGAVVFDPWNKPGVRGLHEYGREDVDTTRIREGWTFQDSPAGAEARATIARTFWETMHIDLRMVDTSDFTIAYCPTNIYSVGTPHEIVLSRLQHKPVLFVSPPVTFPALAELRSHLAGDERGQVLLAALEREVPVKPNPQGTPSLWYMPLVGGEGFFDGFGFEPYRRRFGWEPGPLDAREEAHAPERPLLGFLERLADAVPRKWDRHARRYVPNDDWLLWDFAGDADVDGTAATVSDAHHAPPDGPDGEP